MTLDTPVMRPAARPRRRVDGALVVPGVLLAVVYCMGATWSIGRAFGGVDGDDHWIDDQGRRVATAPPVVDVQGHPALWVLLVLAAILVASAVWAARGDGRQAEVRSAIGATAAVVFVVAVLAVFTALQMHLIAEAFDRGDPHPPILGNATVHTSRVTRG